MAPRLESAIDLSRQTHSVRLDGLRAAAGLSAQRQGAPTIAAASSLNFALTEVAERFARDHGRRVELVFGASGTLTRQIQDGAPFECFWPRMRSSRVAWRRLA